MKNIAIVFKTKMMKYIEKVVRLKSFILVRFLLKFLAKHRLVAQ